MKILFDAEDSVLGIIAAGIIIGLSNKYYSVPDWTIVYGIFFAICALFSFFDIFHGVVHVANMHPLISIAGFLNNLVDVAVEIAFVAFFFNFNIPWLSSFMAPFLTGPWLFWVGVFIGGTSLIWLIAWPMLE
ncbi:hypothetical protein ACFLYT_02060 [Nanoarchaeota archaeon]